MGRQRAAGRVVLLFAGSLSARKNVVALVQAVLRLPHVALLICGEGGERAHISALLDTQDDGGRCQLAGHVSDLRPFFRIADALVLASHAEGLPLVVLEAASEGVPSLLSNVAVHRELTRLGFGATFDRHTFADLGSQASALARDRSSASDERRFQLWKSAFSPQQGFAQYEQLFSRSA